MKIIRQIRLGFIVMAILPSFLCAEEKVGAPTVDKIVAPNVKVPEQPSTKKSPDESFKAKKTKPTITFNFENEELIDIINHIAALKGVNILLPTGANAITAKVTLSLPEPLGVDEAWNMLPMLLNLADYALVLRGTAYNIVKSGKGISKEPLPIYINTPPEKLPDTDQYINYLYYFSNLRVSPEDKNEIVEITKYLLPDATYNVDTTTNGILIMDKARNIKSAMDILLAIDQTMYHEEFEIITLRYTSADLIAKLFNENILKVDKEAFRYRLDTKQENDANYFAKQVKIIPSSRTNAILILGKAQAIERIKDVIQKYIDVPLDSGKSILHVYELQYLDASNFEGILRQIVESMKGGGTGQARGGEAYSSTERYFEGVIIKAFKPAKENEATASGNKLLIAARNDDWQYIKQLIEELDIPMPQVIIEVLIADLTLADTRKLGNILRNPNELPLPDGVNVQAAHIDPGIIVPVIPPAPPNAVTLASDLMTNLGGGNGPNIASSADRGSTLITINDKDGKPWSAMRILKLFDHSKILSHPHIIVSNNKRAFITVGETRLLRDEASAGASGVTTIRFVQKSANLTIDITPRISSSALKEADVAESTVNLDVKVTINQFAANNSQITRNIATNANVKNSGILALGGLISTNDTASRQDTPILGKIPILGWFFKNQTAVTNTTNLTVFISPTIIVPRLRGGVDEYTTDYIKIAEQYSKEGELFDNLRDPITRWFFKSEVDPYKKIDKFISQDELLIKNDIATKIEAPSKNKKRHKKKLKELLAKDTREPELKSPRF